MTSPTRRARVAFHAPYLYVLGGGEKYLLTILEEVTRASDTDVTIVSPTPPNVDSWHRLNVRVDPDRLSWQRADARSVTRLSLGVDLLVAMTNYLPPLSLARHSVAVVQFPGEALHIAGGPTLLRWCQGRIRLASYDSILCYSDFVHSWIERRLGVDSTVVAPPVDLPEEVTGGLKDPLVVAVGRFNPDVHSNNKKHDVLIEAWAQLAPRLEPNGWQLHLAGGLGDDQPSREYIARLRSKAADLAVRFHPNMDWAALANLYRRSTLFWHATGYGETQPERFEHFGITTVEAMAHGCVPIVFAAGGQLEIVQDGKDGRLWRSADELVSITETLIARPDELFRTAAAGRVTAAAFGKERFLERIRESVLRPAGIGA